MAQLFFHFYGFLVFVFSCTIAILSYYNYAISFTELHNHGGLDSEVKDASTQGEVATKTSVDSVLASVTSVPYSNAYHLGVPAQRLPNVVQKTGGHRPTQKWKGPDKISKIYGDWIDDL